MQDSSLFQFEHNEETGNITVIFDAKNFTHENIQSDTHIKITLDQLVHEFSAKGWDASRLNNESAANFIFQCNEKNSVTNPIRESIANIVDGKFQITISQDKMNAYLQIWPASGGRLVSETDVKSKLEQLNIVFGVDEALISELIQKQQTPATVIASGIPAEEGKAAHFISYVEGLVPYDLMSNQDEESFFDLFSLKKLPYIKIGTPIMRLVPKYDGVDGIDITGAFITPKSYPDITFAEDLKGVKFDDLDPNLLIAAVEGKPILHRYGMSVVPYHEINLEGIGTKYIEFEGALVINGDLQNGMDVKVNGDIAVDGTIGISRVEASGRISTSGGIIGAPDIEETSKQVHIVCQGDIRAKFIENANVRSSRSVYCEHAIVGSQVIAGESIFVGKRGVNSGLIRGGKLIAFNKVIAGSIGFDNGLETHIHVGIDLFVDNKKYKIKKRYDEILVEKQKLDKLIKLIFEEPERGENGIAQRVKLSRDKMIEKLDELRSTYQKIEANIHGLESAKIVFYDTLYGGTTISIGNRTMEFKKDVFSSTIYYGIDGEIKLGGLALK
ncbi:DUF342 domain-containing protein [Thorsellia anophelis]|uniref:Flagellar Assembly Protein A N-terminal region domain-containing protein n=1 Tax=Thorsellia anophelis DSM 18579 TaxID=1123402 RepID=A0A1I0BQA6_9GAMM|nr:FapA family protein [Thorsellia anophelis]SET09235.1 hypothetical protein SAMN02583745_01365 [Thorsellia anophelis DSM 18579]